MHCFCFQLPSSSGAGHWCHPSPPRQPGSGGAAAVECLTTHAQHRSRPASIGGTGPADLPSSACSAQARMQAGAMRTRRRPQTTRSFEHLRQRFVQACDDKQAELKTDHRQKDYHMMRAFSQFDQKHSGKISVADMKRALGPGHLGLGVRERDVDHVVNSMPSSRSSRRHTNRMRSDRSNMVTYRRFCRRLDLNNSSDPSPEYNSFVDETAGLAMQRRP